MRFAALFALGTALVACGSATSEYAASSADAVTSVPASTVRDQKEDGNCWLYATTAWAQSMESAANPGQASPGAFSVTYLDYWDWFQKITTGKVTSKTISDIENNDLDNGGSFGSAVELILQYGLVRASDFNGDGAMQDANVEGNALKIMATSLKSGKLATAAARANATLVRSELDRAFSVSAAFSSEMTIAFGADGSTSLTNGGTAADDGHILTADSINVIAPHPDGTSETITMRDAIGDRADGDDPDARVGTYAWNDAKFTPGDAQSTREYFKRIQRALNAGVPLPFGWFFASNADPNDTGVVKTVPSKPADDDDSVGHETVIVDYQVENVPGFGTLAAGTPASDDAKAAALDDHATVTFLRLSDSYGTHIVKGKRSNVRDLYVDYLLGKVRVCPAGVGASSPKCRDEIPLEDVTLPAGF